VEPGFVLVAFWRQVQLSYQDDERSHHGNQEARGDAHDRHFYLMKGHRRKRFSPCAMKKIHAIFKPVRHNRESLIPIPETPRVFGPPIR
jgi:hypothetical protein